MSPAAAATTAAAVPGHTERLGSSSKLKRMKQCASAVPENRNRIGDVDLAKYDKYSHIGYDIDGRKILKSLESSGSEIAKLLNRATDPDSWRTLIDAKSQTKYRLSDLELEIIARVRSSLFASPTFDMTADDSIVDFDNPEARIHPTGPDVLPPKRRFVPSKHELATIKKFVELIRAGKLRPPSARKPPPIYDIWGSSVFEHVSDSHKVRGPPSMPPLKMAPPTSAESYNPPSSFLMTAEQEAEWLQAHEDDRQFNFIPRKYTCLRHVPLYKGTIQERFDRCVDLHTCPRRLRTRLNIDPESLLPQLPDIRDLRPFPTVVRATFDYTGPGPCPAVTCVSVDSTGTYVAVGRANGSLEIFDLNTTRCVAAWRVPVASQPRGTGDDTGTVRIRDSSEPSSIAEEELGESAVIGSVAFNPRLPLLAVGCGSNDLFILAVNLPSYRYIEEYPPDESASGSASVQRESLSVKRRDISTALRVCHLRDPSGTTLRSRQPTEGSKIAWTRLSPNELDLLFRPLAAGLVKESLILAGGWRLSHGNAVTSIAWHPRGLHVAAVCSKAPSPSSQLAVHSIAKVHSICPISRSYGGRIRAATFAPSRPWLTVVFNECVRVYNLQRPTAIDTNTGKQVQQQQSVVGGLVKKLRGPSGLLSVSIHPGGEHIILGSADRKLTWFDFDLCSKPFKVLRYHDEALNTVAFHPQFPLMYSASSDGCVNVYHANVHDDIVLEPTIVPLKKINVRSSLDGPAASSTAPPVDPVLAAAWHPVMPWIVAGLRSGQLVLLV